MTVRIPIINNTYRPDDSIYVAPLSSTLTLTNAKEQLGINWPYPTGSDLGFHVTFDIPENYSSSPVIVLRGIIDGTPANTFAVGCQQLSRASSESVDTAYEAEDTASNGTWTGYADEDIYEISITLTPASAYVAGDEVFCYIYRDDDVDTTTFSFILLNAYFEYTEA